MADQLPFTALNYEPQTRKKHEVLGDYLDKWIKILGRYSGLNYIDCFGGCGAYKEKNGEIFYGSPVIAAQVITQNSSSLGRHVAIVVIESDKSKVENLRKIFDYLNLKIKPAFIEKDFDSAINKLLDDTPNLAPTFFFVDPFGFSIKRATLERIMNIPKSEIFFNFMFNGVNRFLSLPQFEKIFDELFGTQDWKKLCSISENRESCILNKIVDEFKKFSKFVYPYRMCFNNKSRTYYYLLHLSNHYKGCQIMKSCFAKFNRGRTQFLGSSSEQLKLNEVDIFKKEDCKKFLYYYYKKGAIKTFQEICEENICRDFNHFLHSDLNFSVKELEKERKIKIVRDPPITPTGKIRGAVFPKDKIIFQ